MLGWLGLVVGIIIVVIVVLLLWLLLMWVMLLPLLYYCFPAGCYYSCMTIVFVAVIVAVVVL